MQTVWLIGYGSSLGERLTGYENLYSSQPYLTLISALRSTYIHYKVWDEITIPFPNFYDATVEV